MKLVARIVRVILSGVIALVALSGCGKGGDTKSISTKAPLGPCTDLTNGTWSDMYKVQHLVLNDQCQGATDYCNEVFTFAPQPNGTIIVMVSATSGGPECLPIGPTVCSASTTMGVPLHVDCGGGKAISSNYNKM